MKTYGIEYTHDGKSWMLHICADSFDDAIERVRSLYYNGQMVGEHRGSIPAAVPGSGCLADLVCWWKNRKLEIT